jgi:hypothetical protein
LEHERKLDEAGQAFRAWLLGTEEEIRKNWKTEKRREKMAAEARKVTPNSGQVLAAGRGEKLLGATTSERERADAILRRKMMAEISEQLKELARRERGESAYRSWMARKRKQEKLEDMQKYYRYLTAFARRAAAAPAGVCESATPFDDWLARKDAEKRCERMRRRCESNEDAAHADHTDVMVCRKLLGAGTVDCPGSVGQQSAHGYPLKRLLAGCERQSDKVLNGVHVVLCDRRQSRSPRQLMSPTAGATAAAAAAATAAARSRCNCGGRPHSQHRATGTAACRCA